MDFEPGNVWNYSNSGYIVLGYIIEQVSGSLYEKFLQQYIFYPLNMRDTGYDHNSIDLAIGYKDDIFTKADFIDMSIPFASGGLYSTVEDLYRWDQSLYTNQLISQELRDQMFMAHVPIPNSNGASYGYGWEVGQHSGRRVYDHGGSIEGFTTYIGHFPDDKVTIILLSNLEFIDLYLTSVLLAKKVFGSQ